MVFHSGREVHIMVVGRNHFVETQSFSHYIFVSIERELSKNFTLPNKCLPYLQKRTVKLCLLVSVKKAKLSKSQKVEDVLLSNLPTLSLSFVNKDEIELI